MKEISINSVIPCLVKDVPGTLEGQVEAQEGQGLRSRAQEGGLAMETRKSVSLWTAKKGGVANHLPRAFKSLKLKLMTRHFQSQVFIRRNEYLCLPDRCWNVCSKGFVIGKNWKLNSNMPFNGKINQSIAICPYTGIPKDWWKCSLQPHAALWMSLTSVLPSRRICTSMIPAIESPWRGRDNPCCWNQAGVYHWPKVGVGAVGRSRRGLWGGQVFRLGPLQNTLHCTLIFCALLICKWNVSNKLKTYSYANALPEILI